MVLFNYQGIELLGPIFIYLMLVNWVIKVTLVKIKFLMLFKVVATVITLESMNKSIILFFLKLLVISSCSDMNTLKSRQVCDFDECFNIIEYFPYQNSSSRGVYLTILDSLGVPDHSFIHTEYSTLPFYAGVIDDTLHIVMDGWNIIEISNDADFVKFKPTFSHEELIKYHFYDDRENFFSNLKKDYRVYHLD